MELLRGFDFYASFSIGWNLSDFFFSLFKKHEVQKCCFEKLILFYWSMWELTLTSNSKVARRRFRMLWWMNSRACGRWSISEKRLEFRTFLFVYVRSRLWAWRHRFEIKFGIKFEISKFCDIKFEILIKNARTGLFPSQYCFC